MDESLCAICIQTFTKQPNRKQACCPYCDIKSCVTCVQTYLLSTHEDAHCMGCRRGWTREVLDTICLTTWINGPYKKHRENQLLDRERSRLPAAQILVERRKKGQALEPERLKIIAKMANLEKELTEYRANYYAMSARIAMYYRGEDPDSLRGAVSIDKLQEERRVFVMPCPATTCRGFLSQAYKCGVCDTYVCPECREIKNGKDDPSHVCEASTVATVRALKKDTRPCPDCGTCIFKIEGCFAKDTPILLWNGNTKSSQDIIVGDELVGDDGKKRIVETIVTGEDNLYEIKQQNGVSYTVNSKHTLVLKYSGDKTIHHNKNENTYKIIWFSRQEMKCRSKKFNTYGEAEIFRNETLTFTDEIEMTIDDYIKLDKWSKMYLMGYKSCNGITWQEQYISLDPYMLGIWLGDGTACLPDIASNDIEIQQYILKWCQENDAELVHDEGVKFRIRRRNGTNNKGKSRMAIGNGATSDECKGCQSKLMNICNSTLNDDMQLINTEKTTNPFTDLLKNYNLVNNKHIPKEYMMNSRENRLKLLAGLIDTDGHVSKEQDGKRVIITQSDGPLIQDIVLLCRSLGFVVNTRKTERKNVSIFGNAPKDYKDIYTINISGEYLHEIPTLLPRKKCKPSSPNKDYYRTSIDVTFKGKGIYYGWSVDSNRRFLQEDFTVMRNCNQMFCTNCNTPFDWISGKKITNGAIHNPHYFEYLRATNGGIMPRNPGDIPCGANLPGAWAFEREVTRRYPHLAASTTDWLYKALQTITHIQHAEIPNLTNHAQDIDNTEYNVRYIMNEIDEARWKQLLQIREKRRMKRDEVRMRYEAFVGACVDIFGRLMEVARAPPESTTGTPGSRKQVILDHKTQKDSITDVCRQAKEQLLALREIFNTGMMDISKRYKCQVLQLTEVGLKRETRKYEAGKAKPRRVKASDGDTVGDESDEIQELEEDDSVDNEETVVAPSQNELVRT